jgi:hypothetical protein
LLSGEQHNPWGAPAALPDVSEIVYLRIFQSLIAILPIVVKTIAQSMGRASGTPRRSEIVNLHSSIVKYY